MEEHSKVVPNSDTTYKISNLEINPINKKVYIDGEVLNGVTEVDIHIDAHSTPKLSIKMLGNISINGQLLWGEMNKLSCEKCRTSLGEFAGTYAVLCPVCGKFNIRL